MSYCRWSDGDVYLYEDVAGYLNCCGCFLGDAATTPAQTTSRTEMLAHLDEHEAAGHVFPAYAREELRAEIEQFGDEIETERGE